MQSQSTIQLNNNERILLQGKAPHRVLLVMLIIAVFITLSITALFVWMVNQANIENLLPLEIFLFFALLVTLIWRAYINYKRYWYIITDKRCVISTLVGQEIIPNSSIQQIKIYKNFFNQLSGLTMIYISKQTPNEQTPVLWRLQSIVSTFPVESEDTAKKIISLVTQYKYAYQHQH